MRHLFQKGEARLPTAGRRRGTKNKSTQQVGQFCREVLDTKEFQQKWRQYFLKTPLERIEPRLLTLAFHYAYGRPHQGIELSGVDVNTLSPKVIFYVPENHRQTPHGIVEEPGPAP